MNKLQTIKNVLSTNFKERGEVVEGLLIAVTCAEHIFVLGTPGTAKSDIIGDFTAAITDAKYFQRLMHKQLPEQEIFGNYSMKGMENDEFVRVTTGRIHTAHFMFADEIFKCSPSTLNSMLKALNERQYENGDKVNALPLITCLSASNEVPQGNDLAALYDRFILRYQVGVIQDDNNMKSMLTDARTKMPQISMADIKQWQEEAAKLKVPDAVVNEILKIRRAIQEQGLYVSDRTYKKLMKVIRAAAYLDGADEVRIVDLQVLRHMAWADPENRAAIGKLVFQFTHPGLENVVQIDDSIRAMASDLKSKPIEEQEKLGTEYMAKLGNSLKRLEKMKKDFGNMAVIDDAISRAKTLQRYVCYDLMKIEI